MYEKLIVSAFSKDRDIPKIVSENKEITPKKNSTKPMLPTLSYKVLSDLKLIIEYFAGTFKMKDYIELKKQQLNDPEYNPHFNTIGDLRDSEIIATNKDILNCIDFFQINSGISGRRRSAIITATPNQVVYSTLFQNYGKNLPMYYEVVSTFNAAMEWINLPVADYGIVANELSKLKSGS